MKRNLSSLLIILGLILLSIPFAVDYYSRTTQKKLLSDWEKRSVGPSPDKAVTMAEPSISQEDRQDVSPDLFGLLEIPKLGLKAVVMEGTDPFELAKGPGHLKGSAGIEEPGNIVIAGHRTLYGAPFRRLNEMQKGDLIQLQDKTRNVYEVTEIKKVSPQDLSVASDFGDSRITLSTCDPIFRANYRLLVIGKLVKKRPIF